MIETSYLCACALRSNHEDDASAKPGLQPHPEFLVGFAMVSDSPRRGLSEDWLDWFSETHAPVDAEVRITNTLWVDFAVAVGQEEAVVAEEGGETEESENGGGAAAIIESIARTVFSMLPEIDNLVMSLLEDEEDGEGIEMPRFLCRAFRVLHRHANASPSRLDSVFGKPRLLICERSAFLPTLAVSYTPSGSSLRQT